MKNLLLILAAIILTACAEIKPYPDLPNKNLHIQIVSGSGSIITAVKASVEIHGVNADCTTEYKGTMQLDSSQNNIGLPPKQQSYLIFVLSPGFRATPANTTIYKTLLNVRPGYRYSAKVSHMNGTFSIVIHEMNPAGKQSKELGFRDLDGCGKI